MRDWVGIAVRSRSATVDKHAHGGLTDVVYYKNLPKVGEPLELELELEYSWLSWLWV